MTPVSALVCAGCGAAQPEDAVYPFRCVNAERLPDVDHVVTPRLTLASRPDARGDAEAQRHSIDGRSSHHLNPFVRFREFLYSYQFALQHGVSDSQFVDMVCSLDEAIARVDGHGFVITPLRRSAELEARLGIEPPGAIWIKDETHNVSGSHKGRHLFGVLLYLRAIESLRLGDPRQRGLAIASCGNAALAAAVVARAADYSLRVFVPESANPTVVAGIQELGADVEVCRREPGVTGDPSYVRFRQAVASGALPFCCQGNENGLTIAGGATLGLEIAEALGNSGPQRVFVQVGGGALASSCIQAFAQVRWRGRPAPLPRFHMVQTAGAFPLKRAFDRVHDRVASHHDGSDTIAREMHYARTHRAEFMWSWETEPHSIAHGILDDETYDWAALVEAMLTTHGSPVVVDESELQIANDVARSTTGIDVDHTGSAGLAGLMQVLAVDPSLRRQQSAVIFSGVRRMLASGRAGDSRPTM